MALEIQTPTVQNSILQLNNQNQNKVLRTDTIQDQILGIRHEEDDNNDKKNSDKVTLSEQALALLNGTNSGSNSNDSKVSQDSLERQALQFRGLAQIARRTELNDNQKQLLNDIRDNFSKIGINDVGILKIAQRKLNELQTETPDLVQLLNNNEITGGQFQKLNSINKLLNNSNGFGSEQVEGALQVKADQLSKQLDEITSQSVDQKLSRDSINNLETIQRQLSSIQGYQLNVRDTVGPDGVVI